MPKRPDLVILPAAQYYRVTLDEVLDYDNLVLAYKLAKQGKALTDQAVRFEINLHQELARLQRQLRAGRYKVGGYWIFRVHEPKERVIMALPFRDRVVHHALCTKTRPIIERHLITANAANRDNKGTHYAIRMMSQQLHNQWLAHRGGYCLKADISGFFYNIDREILKKKLARLFKDPPLMRLTNQIIDSSPDIRTNGNGKGLPIGNLTSQFWAIYYLSDLDHFIKEKLRIKHYVRYMDDFTLVHHDREYLLYCKKEIERFLWENAALRLNKKTQVFALSQGIDFLGWHFYLNYESGEIIRLLRRDSKIRRRRKLRNAMKYYAEADNYTDLHDTYLHTRQSLNSWLGHIRHGHTYHLREKVMSEFVLVNSKVGLKVKERGPETS